MRRVIKPLMSSAALLALTSCTPSALSDEGTPSETAAAAEVVAVVDGDTIDVMTPTGEERVRIIGIDTPEIGRGGDASECYAEEAREFVDDLLYGHDVELRGDATQADVDAYGRLLRHVFIDGHSAAVETLAAGAGHEYTFDVAYDGQDAHQAAESAARDARLGLWGSCDQ